MILTSVDRYRYYGPLFEGIRIILNYIGEKYTPEYIQGISGAAFKIAGGCPSRPTCVYDMWPTNFIKYLGYEIREYPCFDENGNDVTDKLIEAVKKQIDSGRPVFVWNAFTEAEWDVVCGYDNDSKLFLGRGTHKGWDGYVVDSWDKTKTCNYVSTHAILIDKKVSELNNREAEISSLVSAVKHARKETSEGFEGIQFYKKWVSIYSHEGADRGVADAYCLDVYSSVRKAAVIYLRGIADNYSSEASEQLKKAAGFFELEAKALADLKKHLSWNSPWGVDEERSKKAAPIISEAADNYEKGIEHLEEVLKNLNK